MKKDKTIKMIQFVNFLNGLLENIDEEITNNLSFEGDFPEPLNDNEKEIDNLLWDVKELIEDYLSKVNLVEKPNP